MRFDPSKANSDSRSFDKTPVPMKALVSAAWKLLLVLLVLASVLVLYLNALVATTFSGRKWELPARVYARPLELYPGLALKAEDFEHELELLGYKPVKQVDAPGEMRRNGPRFDIFSRSFAFPAEKVSAQPLTLRFAGGRLASLHSGSRKLDLQRLEPVQIGGIYPRHQEDRLLLQLKEVPISLRQGLLAIEDRGFSDHWGVSPTGIARASLANYRAGRVVQGGSTLTQQLVKNYYLSRERSLFRKATEAVMALLLEANFSKDEILEAYINEVYLGQDGPRAIHGFGLASRHYFDLPLDELGIQQQALLVGMVKGPSLYNPLRHPERALERRNVVLSVMRQQGVINEAQAAVTSAMPLGLSTRPRVMNSYPAFLDLVRRQLRRDYREEDLGSLGLSIFTSFDPILQRQAEQSIQQVLDQLDKGGELQTALVVTSFGNGEVKALLGGRRPRFAGFNRALDALRPVGSLIKPAVYLTALEQSQEYTLATVLRDEPMQVPIEGGDAWQPRNFDRKSHGRVLLHKALSLSYNQATAQLGLDLGIDAVQDTVRRLGVDRPVPAVPAMLLGAGALAPIDIAAMYQTIAAGGFTLPLHTIRDIVDARGEVLQRFPLHYDRAVSVEAMHLLHYALREVTEEGTGKGVRRYLGPDFHVAGKTGTTNGNRDSWFAGFSGDLLAVSWIGRDDNGSTGLTGAGGALKIWGHFMARASRAPLQYRVPQGIEHFWIDEQTGKLSAKRCEGARLMPFIEGSQPREHVQCIKRGNPVLEWFRDLF
jgi:penicillin-binding protein 1B